MSKIPAQPQTLTWTPGRPLAGRYVMKEKLGAGGMGAVYLASDLLLRRTVAVKTLFVEHLADPDDVARFRKEVATAHAVNHPNIARTYDLGEAGGVLYITMEHLAGETLMARVRRGPMTSAEVIAMAIPLCRGLRAAHRAGVVHRDLKPANIMLMPDVRKVVVLDFGIARTMSAVPTEDLEMTRPSGRAVKPTATPWDVTSAGLGTPVYMAPEQWDQLSGDQRTDIYALGVILYVCLVGEAPYTGVDAREIEQRHRSAPIPDLRAKGVDKPLAVLIHRCLAKAPADRPQSMDDVLAVLEAGPRRRTYALQMAATVVIGAVVMALIGLGMYLLAERAVLREVGPSIRRLAELVALRIDVRDLDQVRAPADIDGAPFRRVSKVLQRFHKDNPEIQLFYTMRPAPQRGLFLSVVDDEPRDRDRDGDGRIDPNELGWPPGRVYTPDSYAPMKAMLDTGKPQSDADFTAELGAVSLSGYAPVLRGETPSDYFVGVDVTNEQLTRLKLRLTTLLALAYAAVVVGIGIALAPGRQLRRALAASDRHGDRPGSPRQGDATSGQSEEI